MNRDAPGEVTVQGRRLMVRHRFFSLKNMVLLVADQTGKEMVYKCFVKGRPSLVREKANLLRFAPESPALFGESEDALLLEYIEGENLLDVYVRLEEEGLAGTEVLDNLVGSLGRLYRKSPGYRLGDMNLRNFILEKDNGRIRFVDYEEASVGKREEDAGRLMAFLLTYRPVDTVWKRTFVSHLTERLVLSGLDGTLIRHYAEDELTAISHRRRMEKIMLPEGFPDSIC